MIYVIDNIKSNLWLWFTNATWSVQLKKKQQIQIKASFKT